MDTNQHRVATVERHGANHSLNLVSFDGERALYENDLGDRADGLPQGSLVYAEFIGKNAGFLKVSVL